MTKQEALKLFEDKKVRTVWDDEQEKWYFSIIDVIAILTDSPDPKRYWSVLKSRIKKEGHEPTTICSTLKLRAADGKMRLTDVADTEQLEQQLGRSVISSVKANDYLLLSEENKSEEKFVALFT